MPVDLTPAEALGIAALIGGLAGVLITALALGAKRGRAQRGPSAETLLLASRGDGCFAWLAAEGAAGSGSPGLARLFGLAPDKVQVFGAIAFLFPAGQAVALTEAVNRLREQGTPFRMPLETKERPGRFIAEGVVLPERGGHAVWFQRRQDESGEIDGLAAIADAAAAERAHFQNLLDTVPFPIWQRRPDGKLVWVNRAYGLYAGCSAEQAVREGRELETDSGSAQALAARAAIEGDAMTERRQVKLSGELRDVEAIEMPIGHGGDTAGFVRDVTDLVDAEGEIDRLRQLGDELMAGLPVGVAVFGADRRLAAYNPAYAALWRLDRAWLESQPDHGEILDRLAAAGGRFDAVGLADAKRGHLTLHDSARLPADGVDVLTDGMRVAWHAFRRGDGSLVMVHREAAAAVAAGDGGETHALRTRAEALESAERLRQVFLASASTELRTPLTAAIGFAELLLSAYGGPLNSRQQDYVRDILHVTQHLLGMIDDVLGLAGAESGQIELTPSRFALPALLDEVAEAARTRAASRKVWVAIDCPATIGEIVGDRPRLARSFGRLVDLAVDRTPDSERVTLGAARAADEVAIWVADSGPPMTEEAMTRLFEPFARIEGSRGYGVSLALTKALVERHGGQVEATDTTTGGLSVIVRLPASQSSTAGVRMGA
ncbi:MAG: HAMP domain-containing histidine kinase [Alphaproteobacteria bacterium]|nr:HAMP domain-containing histidine kinase [Alphaproteobacteria bacterium]